MVTRYGISPWVHQYPASRIPRHPRFRGTRDAAVVIIGGGLTGCATAYACAAAGLRPVLLEGERIGQGSSGRSMGLLLPEPGPAFRDIVAAHGLRAARTAFESWRRAALDAAAGLKRAGIRCGLESCDLVTVVASEGEKAWRRELEARQAAGLEATWVPPRPLRHRTALDRAGALASRAAFSLDPYRACLGLSAAAWRQGATLFERSAVKKISWGATHAEVVTGGGTIRAEKVVVTTGAATAEYKPLQRHFERRETYLVLSEPVPRRVDKLLGRHDVVIRDRHTPPHTLQWAMDDRLLVSGADQGETPERTRKKVLVQRTGQLMYETLTMYPAISGLKPAYGWELAYGATADGLMYVGPHRNYPHHLFALGGGGGSITGAFLASRVLLRALQGAPEKADGVWSWTR